MEVIANKEIVTLMSTITKIEELDDLVAEHEITKDFIARMLDDLGNKIFFDPLEEERRLANIGEELIYQVELAEVEAGVISILREEIA